MNIGILDGKYVTIIDDKHVLQADSSLCKVSTGKVLDTLIRLGDIHTIILSNNPSHYFSDHEPVIILSVYTDEHIQVYGLDSHKNQIISLEDIDFHVPQNKKPQQWLDLQGEPVKVGDTVMVMNVGRSENGKRVIVEKLDMDPFDTEPMMRSGSYHKDMRNVLKINTMLPPHVTMEINPDQPKTIYVSLWNKEHTRVIKSAEATCSNSDAYSFEFGLYGVALPRLFDREIRQ